MIELGTDEDELRTEALARLVGGREVEQVAVAGDEPILLQNAAVVESGTEARPELAHPERLVSIHGAATDKSIGRGRPALEPRYRPVAEKCW